MGSGYVKHCNGLHRKFTKRGKYFMTNEANENRKLQVFKNKLKLSPTSFFY